MSRLKYRAAKQLGAALELQPALAGKVQVLQQPPDKLAAYPTLVVLPERFRFIPWQHEDLTDDNGDAVFHEDGRAAFEVGELTGRMRLWCGAQYAAQREPLEDAVLEAFNGDDTAPGRLLSTMTDVEISGENLGVDWPVACLLQDEEWREEMVFSEKRWSFMHVQVDVPVLLLRSNAWKITQQLLCISQDVETTISDPADLANLTDVETVLVNDDGSVSAPP